MIRLTAPPIASRFRRDRHRSCSIRKLASRSERKLLFWARKPVTRPINSIRSVKVESSVDPASQGGDSQCHVPLAGGRRLGVVGQGQEGGYGDCRGSSRISWHLRDDLMSCWWCSLVWIANLLPLVGAANPTLVRLLACVQRRRRLDRHAVAAKGVARKLGFD